MDNKNSQKLLQELHDEIKNTSPDDEKGKEMLRDLDGELRALLEGSKGKSAQLHPPLIQQLQDALDHFEVTHPDLTMAICRLLESLSNAGI